MKTQSSNRTRISPLELWPVEEPSGSNLPAVIDQAGPLVTRRGRAEEEAMERFQADFTTFIARLTDELQSLRVGLTEVRTEVEEQADPAPSLRERALDARLAEVASQVQKLNAEVARLSAQQAERERMRRFSD